MKLPRFLMAFVTAKGGCVKEGMVLRQRRIWNCGKNTSHEYTGRITNEPMRSGESRMALPELCNRQFQNLNPSPTNGPSTVKSALSVRLLFSKSTFALKAL